MKLIYGLMMTFAVVSVVGCANPGKVRVTATEVDPIQYTNNSEFLAVGPVQMNPLGPVFYKKDGERCSELDLMMVASKTYSGMSDVINIRMEETSVTETENMKEVTKYSCKCYGLAVAYVPLKKETLDAYLLLKKPTTSILVQNPKADAQESVASEPAVGYYTETGSAVEAQ